MNEAVDHQEQHAYEKLLTSNTSQQQQQKIAVLVKILFLSLQLNRPKSVSGEFQLSKNLVYPTAKQTLLYQNQMPIFRTPWCYFCEGCRFADLSA